jgi:hypothetical protein
MAVTWTGFPPFGTGRWKVIGGAIRNTAGSWAAIDDEYHRPIGIGSVEKSGTYELKLNYSFSGKEVGALSVTVDDALAPLGITTGASVGMSFSYVYFHAPFSCYMDGTTVEYLHALWTDAVEADMVDATTLQITHPPTHLGDHPVISQVAGSGRFQVGYNTDRITIKAVDDLNGFVDYDVSNGWTHTNTTNTVTPTFAYNAGVLRVTHGDAGMVGAPLISAHGGTYIPHLHSLTDAYFEVRFFDYAGNLVTVENTAMAFWYRRAANVPAVYPSDAKVFIRRGSLPVPVDNFALVAGNNFWVTGWMEVE